MFKSKKHVVFIFYAILFHTAFSSENVPVDFGNVMPLLEDYAKNGMDKCQVPGLAIVILKKGQEPQIQCFGVREEGANEAIAEDTVFQIGSTSKAFTSMLVGMLISDGKFRWKDKVIDHDPTFRMSDPWVTSEFMIEDLMAQRSGLPSQALSVMGLFTDLPEDVIRAIKEIPLVYSFRSQFSYVNCLFVEAAHIAEISTGQSWAANIKKRIFSPLGMNHSRALCGKTAGTNDATGHILWNGKLRSIPADNIVRYWTDVLGPAGSICSTPADMAKWLAFQLDDGVINGKRLISEESLNLIRTPKIHVRENTFHRDSFYAESWVVMDGGGTPRIIWHNGDTMAFKSMVAFSPKLQAGIVILSNRGNHPLPEALAFRFFDLLARVETPPDYLAEEMEKEDRIKESIELRKPVCPQPPLAAAPLTAYVGKYGNAILPDVDVVVDNGRLTVFVGKLKQKVNLEHWSGNRFLCEIPYYISKEERCFVVFELDANGKAQSMLFGPLESTTRPQLKRISQ